MDKIEQLFIRACKAKDPLKRVKNVYCRFYLPAYIKEDGVHITNILLNICEKYQVCSLTKTVNALNPNNGYFRTVDSRSYHERCVDVFIGFIRLSEVNKFPGLTTPAMFRKLLD